MNRSRIQTADIPSAQTNRAVVGEFNRKNRVSETDRDAIVHLFLKSGSTPVRELLSGSLASMNQDVNPAWIHQKPQRPEIVMAGISGPADGVFDVVAIGGMFAYLNLLYHASRHPGRHCIVTHPNSIFNSAAWTLHPEEDMDQRLVPMFRTPHLIIHEIRRLLNCLKPPDHPRYEAFKIDYRSAIRMLQDAPGRFFKLAKVTLQYLRGEWFRSYVRCARINLERNRMTVRALNEMGLIGADPERHLLNLEGRVVFELPQEKALPLKKALKRAYDLEGRPLSINRLAQRYGADLPVLQDIRRNRLRAVLYSGGYFWAGHRTNALNKARAMGCTVFEAASAVRIRIDAGASKSRIEVRLGDQVKTLLANTVLLAAGDYGPDIIPVDGVSTLFAVETAHRDYRLLPTGMGEGGTIHIVPVETLSLPRNGEMHYYHLGKATNGAVIGRDPFRPKRVQRDRDFIRHLEVHLKKIIPSGSRLLWLTLTACGRPVVAGQGYRVAPLISGSNVGFEAAGGCGLGGNTPIIPQVQAALERRAGAAKQPMLQEQEGS